MIARTSRFSFVSASMSYNCRTGNEPMNAVLGHFLCTAKAESGQRQLELTNLKKIKFALEKV